MKWNEKTRRRGIVYNLIDLDEIESIKLVKGQTIFGGFRKYREINIYKTRKKKFKRKNKI